MKNSFILRLAALILSVLVMLPLPVSAGLTDAAVQSYEEQLAALQKKKSEALGQIEDIRASSTDTLEEIRKFDEVIRYNEELKKLEMSQLSHIEEQIADAERNIADYEEKIVMQQTAFERRMVAGYMEEEVDFIELILSSESLTDFLTRLERIIAVLENDREIIKNIESLKNQLESEKVRLDEAETMQLARIAELESIITDSEALLGAKEAYLDELRVNESAWTAVYAANAEAEAELNRELEAYLAELERQKQSEYVGEYSSDSILGLPIDPDAYYYISSEQGWRTLNGVSENHLGMDIACAAGTDILAANSGTVLKSEEHWSYGNYVLIDHGGGISTLYAHMSECLVSAGDTVEAGQLIGHCGLTGYTLGYHLHFEVRENGKVQNPRNYITLP